MNPVPVNPPVRMNPLAAWTEQVCTELGLSDLDARHLTGLVLNLARDVAHAVDRPAAPLTAYLVGLAAGRAGTDPSAASDEIVRRVNALVAGWAPPAQE